MRTIVTTGGTSGIGEALASAHLDRGDRVIVIGPDQVKGDRYLQTAQTHGRRDRAVFIRADLSLRRGYDGWTAMSQGGRLNDLLGVAFAAKGHRARYVLLFPGGTRTGLAGDFDAPTAALVAQMKQNAQPVEATVPPIAAAIDSPPPEPLSAFVEGRRISLRHPNFDSAAAAHLETLTHELLRPHLSKHDRPAV